MRNKGFARSFVSYKIVEENCSRIELAMKQEKLYKTKKKELKTAN